MSFFERNKQLYREFITTMQGDDLAALDECLTADFHSHPDEGLPPGPEGERQAIAAFRRSFSDVRYRIDSLVANDTHTGCIATVTGRHSGDFLGVPATGLTFQVRSADIMRVEGGKFAEHWSVFDSPAMLSQLGIVDGSVNPDGDGHRRIYTNFVESIMTPDLDGIENCLNPEYFSHSYDVPPGPDGERLVVGGFRAAFPDYHYAIHELVTDGESVASLARISGTQRADYLGHPASDRRFEVFALDFARVSDGKLSEHRGVFEEPQMLRQLGITPELP